MQPFQQQPSRNGFARDMTDADLSAFMPIASREAGGLNIQFFYAQVPIKGRHGRSRIETRLCVAKQPKGDRYTIATREISEEQAMAQFPREFAHFKKYQEVPTNGTPLHELPGLSQSQIAILTLNGLRSVEDLAEISPDVVGGAGMEAVSAQKLAVAWIAKRNGNADMIKAAEMTAAMEAREAETKARMDAMESHNLALQRQIEMLMNQRGGGAAPQGGYASEPQMVDASGLPGMDDLPEMPSGGNIAEGLDDLLTNPLED